MQQISSAKGDMRGRRWMRMCDADGGNMGDVQGMGE